MNNPKVQRYSTNDEDGRKRETGCGVMGVSGLAAAGASLRIAAVKRAGFYLFIVGLLKRW